MPIFDGFLAVFSLAVGIFAGIGGRKAGVGVDACYQRFPAERLGLTSGCWLAGPWSKSTPLRSPASPCAIIDVFAHKKWRAQPRERLRNDTPRLPQESPDRARLRCRPRKRARTRPQFVRSAAQLGLPEARRQPAGVLVQDSRRVQQDGAALR